MDMPAVETAIQKKIIEIEKEIEFQTRNSIGSYQTTALKVLKNELQQWKYAQAILISYRYQ